MIRFVARRRFRTCPIRRGIATVEFAIVLPLLMLVTFGIIEFGSVMYTRHNMVQAAREAARVLAIREGTVAEANAVAMDRLSAMSQGINFTVNITNPSSASGETDVIVEITAPLAEAALMDPMGIMGDGIVRVTATMRKEE
jgi:Flp pilus assembly protein TadG